LTATFRTGKAGSAVRAAAPDLVASLLLGPGLLFAMGLVVDTQLLLSAGLLLTAGLLLSADLRAGLVTVLLLLPVLLPLPVLLSLLRPDRVSFALTAAGAVVACAVPEPVLVAGLVSGGVTALVLKLLLNPIARLRAELVTSSGLACCDTGLGARVGAQESGCEGRARNSQDHKYYYTSHDKQFVFLTHVSSPP